jgi:quercetin dioxygenase-like cupin family protein
MQDFLIQRSTSMEATPTRRSGISERRLLVHEQSAFQNVVLVDTEQSAEVEFHQISNSESIFILEGQYEVIGPNSIVVLSKGDFCYFEPGSSHGLKCSQGPGRILVVFAPGAPITHSEHTTG